MLIIIRVNGERYIGGPRLSDNEARLGPHKNPESRRVDPATLRAATHLRWGAHHPQLF